MAFGTPVNRGTASGTTSANTLSLTPASTAPAGDLAILLLAANNQDDVEPEHTGITDPTGNTWTKREEETGRAEGQAAGGGITGSIWTSILTNDITTADALALQLAANQTAKAAALITVPFDGPGLSFDLVLSAAGVGSPGPSISTGTLLNVPRLYVAGFCYEGPASDGFTNDPDYANRVTADAGLSGNDNILVRLLTRDATLTGDTWTMGVGVGRDYVGFLLAISETGGGSTPVQSEPVDAIEGESAAIAAAVRAFGTVAAVGGERAAISAIIRFHAALAAIEGESAAIAATSAVPLPIPARHTIAGAPGNRTITGARGSRTITGWPS